MSASILLFADGTLLSMAGVIGTALVTAIVALWNDLQKSKKASDLKYEETQKYYELKSNESEMRYNHLESKNEKTEIQLLKVTEDIGELKGRVHFAEELSAKIDKLTEAINRDQDLDQ